MARPSETAKRKPRRGEKEVDELLTLARERTPKDLRMARAAVKELLAIASRLRLRIPLDEKRKLCRGCYAYLVPGQTSATRVRKGRIIVRCLACSRVKRLQYRRGR